MEFLQAGSQKRRLSTLPLFVVVDEDERMRVHVLELGPHCGRVGGGTFKRQGIVGGLMQLGEIRVILLEPWLVLGGALKPGSGHNQSLPGLLYPEVRECTDLLLYSQHKLT